MIIFLLPATGLFGGRKKSDKDKNANHLGASWKSTSTRNNNNNRINGSKIDQIVNKHANLLEATSSFGGNFLISLFNLGATPLVLLPKRDLVHAICIRSTCASMDRQPLTLQAEQTPEKDVNNH